MPSLPGSVTLARERLMGYARVFTTLSFLPFSAGLEGRVNRKEFLYGTELGAPP